MMVYDYKPETDEERAERKIKQEESLVFKNVSFEEATSRIAALLLKITYVQKIPINQSQPKTLGNVNFWIENSEQGPILRYTKPPHKWERDEIIFQLESEEYNLSFRN